MPRSTAWLAARFAAATSDALALVEAGHSLRNNVRGTRRYLSQGRLELIHELAYLRCFAAWEDVLEQSFLRFLAGYAHGGGREVLVTPPYSPTLSAAALRVLGTRSYLLWHSASLVILRGRGFFAGGRHETVLGSALSRLDWMASVRHRIAHSHDDARAKFDSATLGLAGRTYPGSRPGRFLNDLNPGASPVSPWLNCLVDELLGLSVQITA